jgi:hypothetical protein
MITLTPARPQDIPIVRFTNRENGEVKENCVFCADILDVLTQNFFAQKGKHVEEKPHVEDVKVSGAILRRFVAAWDRCYDFVNIFAEKLGEKIGFLFKTKLNYVCKILIITLVLEKIVIITSTPVANPTTSRFTTTYIHMYI